jgi:hypothetical protein
MNLYHIHKYFYRAFGAGCKAGGFAAPPPHISGLLRSRYKIF